MPKITPVHWKELKKIFEDYGCSYKRKKGSHHILIHLDAKRAIVIPEYSEIDVDIIKSNMRTVGMTRDEYFELLKGKKIKQEITYGKSRNNRSGAVCVCAHLSRLFKGTCL